MQSFKKVFTVFGLLLALSLVTSLSVLAQDAAQPLSTSDVYSFADDSQIEGGWSRLARFDEGVTVTLHTSDLVPNEVYTIWWVIFNQPENCTDGVCSLDDLFIVDENGLVLSDQGARQMNMEAIEAAQISVQHATGALAGEDGIGHFSASIGEGAAPGIVFGPGLVDAQTAEVHLVVRTHGPLVDELFDDQISTFLGGCAPFEVGEAPCADVQYAIHLPSVQ